MKEQRRCYNCMYWLENGQQEDNICGNLHSKKHLDVVDGRDHCEDWDNDVWGFKNDCED